MHEHCLIAHNVNMVKVKQHDHAFGQVKLVVSTWTGQIILLQPAASDMRASKILKSCVNLRHFLNNTVDFRMVVHRDWHILPAVLGIIGLSKQEA